MTILKSQAFGTGTKFMVTDESVDGTVGPGTTGFVSLVKGQDQDFENVLYLSTVIIRRGKSGKERLEIVDISTPVFDIDNNWPKDKMPDEKRRNYVHINPMPMAHNIMILGNIDMIGYGLAYGRLLTKLISRVSGPQAKRFNSEKIINSFAHLNNYYADDPEGTVEKYSGDDVRDRFIRQARLAETSLTSYNLEYMYKVCQIENRAIRGLIDMKSDSIPKGVLTKTAEAYAKKEASLKTLYHQAFSKKKRTKSVEDVSWS